MRTTFVNTNAALSVNTNDGDGNINADTLNLSLPGDFDYASGYLNNGNININNLNLQVGGNFSYDDVSNDFVWNASDSLVAKEVFLLINISNLRFNIYKIWNCINGFPLFNIITIFKNSLFWNISYF